MQLKTKICKHCQKEYETDLADLRPYCSTICLLQGAITQLESRVAALDAQLRLEQGRSSALRHELAISYRRVDELENVKITKDWLDSRPGEFL